MSKRRKKAKAAVTFDAACARLESALSGSFRRDVVARAASASTFEQALMRLRDGMRSHQFDASGETHSFARLVHQLDRRTQDDGFHVLRDWDGEADRLNDDIIPVDVATFMLDKPVPEDGASTVLSILLDYYFLYVLAVLTLRAWDEGAADENLDRVDALVEALQGPDGSGQQFVRGTAILTLVATSHFEPDETAYGRLLSRIRTLTEPRRDRTALVFAGAFSSHLRFGFEATYGRDIVTMRNDNGPDYPWLLFALETLMSAYSRFAEVGFEGVERDRVVEGLVNGLAPDPRAFLGEAPDSLTGLEAVHDVFRRRFEEHRDALVREFEAHVPTSETYSPMALYFNFIHNTLKGVVVDSLLRAETCGVPIDDLLTAFPESGDSVPSEALARTLMGYAQASPDRIRGQLVPVIVYDPRKARRAFTDALRRLAR